MVPTGCDATVHHEATFLVIIFKFACAPIIPKFYIKKSDLLSLGHSLCYLSSICLSVYLAIYHVVLSKIKKSNLSSFFAFSCICHIPCPAMGLVTLLVSETGNNCSIYLNKQKQCLWLKKLSCSSVVLSVAVSRS